jgi:hypothetical protein
MARWRRDTPQPYENVVFKYKARIGRTSKPPVMEPLGHDSFIGKACYLLEFMRYIDKLDSVRALQNLPEVFQIGPSQAHLTKLPGIIEEWKAKTEREVAKIKSFGTYLPKSPS